MNVSRHPLGQFKLIQTIYILDQNGRSDGSKGQEDFFLLFTF